MSSQKMSNEQLVLRIKAGENVADNMLQLWQQNKKFISSIAKKYAAYEEIEDLIQQGYFGMSNAVNGYDPEAAFLSCTMLPSGSGRPYTDMWKSVERW